MSSAEPVLQLARDYIARKWTPEDRDSVLEIIKNCLASYGLPFQADGADVDAVNVEEYYWKNDSGEFFVIEDRRNGKVVGSGGYYDVTAERGELSVEVRKMYLMPEARGKGIGRAILSKMEERIRQKGFKSIYIETVHCLKRACQLYEAAGYTDVRGHTLARCDRLMKKVL
ncbi:uncharacterized N-acetyltransferase YjgM-like [Oscarella lobularis]|uniref:uncharacterized N-acetyltransferase YjgM-like n=1 Tax=Oscarella lobularis TaxID=121494 RepID=UPI0033139D48